MTEPDLFNISEICRGCLSDKKGHMRSIFDSNLLETLILCTNVQVAEHDGLPALICSSCVYKVIPWVTFKKQCEQSDNILRTTFQCSENQSTATTNEQSSSQVPKDAYDPERVDVIELTIEKVDTFHQQLPKLFSDIEDDSSTVSQTEEHSNTAHLHSAKSIEHVNEEEEEEETHEGQEFADDVVENECEEDSIANNVQPPKAVDLKRTSSHKKRVTCNECGKTFRNPDRLKSHQRGEHEGKKPEICSICQKEFNNLRALRRHRLKHSELKQFSCNECGKLYKYQTSLTLHKKGHANVRRFVCDLCGKSFVRLHGLQSHLISHSTLTPFTCDYNSCGKQFKNAIMLKNHRKRHDGIKGFVCSECGKEFITSAELTTHSRSHTGSKPYGCSMCDKSYKTQSHLSVHYRSHSGARPYACDICPLTFAHNKVLKQHRLVHLGQRPWICDICQRPFRQRITLMKHQKVHIQDGKEQTQPV